MFTTEVRRALPLVQPKNLTSRAITLRTLVGLVTRGFVRSVDYTAARKRESPICVGVVDIVDMCTQNETAAQDTPAEVTESSTVNAATVIRVMTRGDSSRSLGAVAGTCLIDNTGGRFGD